MMMMKMKMFRIGWILFVPATLLLHPFNTPVDGLLLQQQAYPLSCSQRCRQRRCFSSFHSRSDFAKSTYYTPTVLAAVGFPFDPISQNSDGGDDNDIQRQTSSNISSQRNGGRKDKANNSSSANNTLFDADTRQLLGLGKQPSTHNEKWKIRLQLAKPVSWVPLSFIVMCGAAASGQYHSPWSLTTDVTTITNNYVVDVWQEDAIKAIATMILAGPFSEGFAQTINDWYDQDIDAINEPYRPIPSGAITPQEVLQQLIVLFVGGLGLAMVLDYCKWMSLPSSSDHSGDSFIPVVTILALIGYCMSYIYSAPPMKLKQNGWMGGLAMCICYIAFPWLCGHAVFGNFERPEDLALPILYSFVGLGPAIVNDFKSIEGDTKFGLKSIPVLYGVEKSKWVAVGVHDCIQLFVAGYLLVHAGGGDDRTSVIAAAILLTLLIPQIYLQKTLLFDNDPIQNDMKYIGLSQPFVVLGLLITGIAIGEKHHLLM